MSETDPFFSEGGDGADERTRLEEYFSQSLEVDLLLRLCPDDEDTIYQIVDLLVDTGATSRKESAAFRKRSCWNNCTRNSTLPARRITMGIVCRSAM